VLNSHQGRKEFYKAKGGDVLNRLATEYYNSREIACNLSRIFSVLSQVDEAKDSLNTLKSEEKETFEEMTATVEDTVQALQAMTAQHPRSPELVVRTTFALGNIAAKDDRGRAAIAERAELTNVLVDILEANADQLAGEATEGMGGNLVGDVLVK